MGWVIYNSAGVPLVTSKNHDHTVADGSGPLTDDEHDGYSEYDEIAAPGAGAADKLRLYTRDDSGVTRPYAVDSDGLESELAGYTLIDSVTLGAPAQILANFQNIPAKFRNLRVVFAGKSAAGGSAVRNVIVRLNNDAAGNYHVQFSDDGAQTQVLNANRGYVGRIDGVITGHYTGGTVEFPAYTNTALEKSILSASGYVQSADIVNYSGATVWIITAAINRIQVFTDAATAIFDVGSVCYLYGY